MKVPRARGSIAPIRSNMIGYMTIFHVLFIVVITSLAALGYEGWKDLGVVGALVGMALGGVWLLLCRVGYVGWLRLFGREIAFEPRPQISWPRRAAREAADLVRVEVLVLWVVGTLVSIIFLMVHLLRKG